MTWRGGDRIGATSGDFLFGIAVLTLGLALGYPTIRARGFDASVAETVADVQTLRRSAEGYLRDNRAWPTPRAPGVIPSELFGAFPGQSDLRRGGYTLQWARFEVVDHVEVPGQPNMESVPLDVSPDSIPPTLEPVVREVGAIVLYSSDDALIGALLERYGTRASFVRDTTWTLILPARGGS